MKRAECPKCKEVKPLTRHHILPRRFFKVQNAPIFYICRECHDELELMIPVQQKKERHFYFEVINLFLATPL